jgi:transposase
MIRHTALGIDVSAEWFDVHIFSSRESQRFDYTQEGVAKLLSWLEDRGPGRFHAGLEATGRLEIELARALQKAGHRVSVLDPMRVVRHRQSYSRSAKTDRQDARAIARYVAERRPEEWVEKPEPCRQLAELCLHREHLLDEIRRLENWLRRPASDPGCRQDVESLMTVIELFLSETEVRLREAANSDAALSRQVERLCTIKGIAFQTAVSLLSEIGSIDAYPSARDLALAAGLAPMMCASGKNPGKGLLPTYGNERLRRSIYMAALVAKQRDPAFREFAERIAHNSPKKPKTVIVATMRKLIHVVYGVLKHDADYDPNLVRPYPRTANRT